MSRFSNKSVLITGGNAGIGAAAARAFASEGASVMIAARRADKAAAVVEEIGDAAAFIQCDVSRGDDCAAAVAATVERFGRLVRNPR